MPNSILSIEDIRYIADMLRAVRLFKTELAALSSDTLLELDENTKLAEETLRRVADEMTRVN